MNQLTWLEWAAKSTRNLTETEFDRDKLANQLITVLEHTLHNQSFQAEIVALGQY